MPVSAHECAASATMDADPVTAAATDLAIASSALAVSATSTVSSEAFSLGSSGRVGESM